MLNQVLNGAMCLSPFLFNFISSGKKKADNSEFEISTGDELPNKIKYSDQVSRLRNLKENPETSLEILDALAQDFFRKRFHIKKNFEYSELVDFFREKNNLPASDFCRHMMESLYSGEEITQEKINDLLTDLEVIMDKDDPTRATEAYHKSKLGSIIDSLNIFENEKERQAKDVYVGAKTKKIIKSRILENKKVLAPQKKKVEIAKEESNIKKESMNSALTFIQPSDSKIEEEPEEDKNIGSIDDLDRIKSKIQQRKSI